MDISIRSADIKDAQAIVALIQELAQTHGEVSPVTPEYAAGYLSFPGCGVLLAETGGQVVGLLSYSVRPNLYHAGDTALIEELVVKASGRGRGVGKHLVKALLSMVGASGCVEVSVTTMPDNQGAQRFYRSLGLVDEAVYLEKHLLNVRSG